MLLPKLVQVTESISGSVVPLAMFHLVFFSVRLFFALQVAARSTQTEAAAFVLRCTPPAPTSEYKTTQANSIKLKLNGDLIWKVQADSELHNLRLVLAKNCNKQFFLKVHIYVEIFATKMLLSTVFSIPATEMQCFCFHTYNNRRLKTEDNLTPTEDTLADLLVLINSFGPSQLLVSLPQVAQPWAD